MPKQIFDKAKRELAKRSIDPAFHPFATAIGFDYVEALEEIAKAAQNYITNSTPGYAVALDVALDAVDRMRE